MLAQPGGIALVRAVSAAAGEDHRALARPPVRSAQEGFQPPVSEPARCSNFRRPNRCWTSISPSRCSRWSTASRSRRTCASAWWIPSRSVIAKRAKSFSSRRGGGEPLRFNEKFACKRCGKEFVEPEPSLFSFNNPYGACKRCQGFGNTIDYDMDLVIPDRSLSIQEGAVDPWTKPQHSWYLADFRKAVQGQGPLQRAVLRAARRRARAPLRAHPRATSRKSKPRSTRSTCACS